MPLTITKGAQSVSYAYDNFHKLTGITHGGTTYSFEYDKFSNRTKTKVGNRTLATYNYASNNGYLQGMTYGNGYTQSYTYDRFGNMAEIKYGNTTVLKNFADSSGAIIRTQDLLTNYEHRISYDSTGRLISKELLDLSVTGNADKWLHSLEYNFDANNNVTHFAFADKNRSFVTAYEYGKDNLLAKTTLPSGNEVGYTYDNLGRLIGKNLNTSNAVNATYTYHESLRDDEVVDGVTKNYTTLKIASEETPAFGYKYTYDELGNISAVYEGVKGTDGNYSYSNTPTMSYVYDANGQLVKVNDFVSNEQYEYVYNSAGNITRRYHYTMDSDWQPATTLENIRYTYGDTNGWKDLMTKYNGQTITYDAIGNPLNYRDGITLTWQNGRELATFSQTDGANVSYTYDASGMRTSKTLTSDGATDTVKYVYENGLLLQMQYNHMYFDFIYDANGLPVSMAYRSTAASSPIYYYYGLNFRGDVIALYYNTGAIAARYSYDAYGKLLGVTTSSGSQFTAKYAPAVLNPLRYRGYVYDTETGFYYLQSRYYDPTTCRFVNADGYCSTGVGLTGNNMFAYCNNNPIFYVDDLGTKPAAGMTVGDETDEEKLITYAIMNNRTVSNKGVETTKTELEIDYGLTYSNGIGVSANVGFIAFTGQGGVSVDAKGNVGIQFSVSYSINASVTGSDYGASFGSYNMFTNAGDIYKLEYEGYQLGVGATAPIPHTKMNGFVESNFVILPTLNPRKCYVGYSDFKGISTYGSPDFNFHFTGGYTFDTKWDFNIYNVFGG